VYYYTLKEWELFDLKRDPHELKNLYGDPAHARTRDLLTTELRRLQRELKDPDPVF